MIIYEIFCKIHKLFQENLKISQIAIELQLHIQTVRYWLHQKSYHQRKPVKRSSKLDPYKPQILSWLEKHPYTSVQIFQCLKEIGYCGGLTIVREYVHKVRPPRQVGFLTLSFLPGECAQVDWGQYGTVTVGSTKRKLSFFVMVLCYSRMMYLEFTVLERMEHFLTCHHNAFRFFGGVPGAIMVDNLKSAVLKRFIGQAPVFNPKYLDFANHYGFTIRACNVGKGNEKGRVENGVGYVKKNFLAGLDIPYFSAIHPAAQKWMDQIANVRIHATTHKQPVVLFENEKSMLQPLPQMPYDTATISTVCVTNQFRIVLDSNRYSVPAEYSSSHLTLKAYPDRLCLYHNNKLIAHHVRSYDRHQNFEDPDHPRELLKQRQKARNQQLFKLFLAISSKADDYYKQLAKRRMNPTHHIKQIVALSEIYGVEKVKQALEDSFTFQVFSSEYIANILEQRSRIITEPGALHLTRRQDLLELDIDEPNLSIYYNDQEDGEGEYTDE